MSYTPYPANREINTDAGGRTRVSTITTLFDGKTLNFDDPLSWENVGTGSATFGSNKVNLAVTAGQYIIRRSRRYLPYFSGKSQIIETTFDGFDTSAGLTERVGYFSSNAVAPYNSTLDGFFIENVEGVIAFKAYRFGTLTMNVPFTSWDNYQQLQSYDWTKFSVVIFDFLWLGGTEVRIWLKTASGFVLAHTVHWASLNTDTFIGSPNHNVRYEVRSTTGVGSLRCICSAVGTEGDVTSASKSQSIFSPSAVTTNAVGTIYAVKSLKKIATARDLSLTIASIGVANTATADFGLVMLIANPTLSAPIAYVDRQGYSEGTPTTQTITAGTGTVIYAEPVGSAGSASELDFNFRAGIGMSIENVSDEYVLAYVPTSLNQAVFGTMNFKII
jgi:hypothetical protein